MGKLITDSSSVTTVGLDLAKHVFQVHCVDASGRVVVAKTRPSMRFVGVRSLENQAALMRHKAREMLVTQRTQLLNGLRGHLTEVGVIAPQGLRCARELAELIEACDETIPFEVWRSQTSPDRASAATAPRLPAADRQPR